MASQINYARTAGIICFVALGADLCVNRGRIITGLATGLGKTATELIRRAQSAFSRRDTSDAFTYSVDPPKKPKNPEYRLGYPGAFFIDDPKIQQEALKEALDHVKKDYPEEYEKLISKTFSSQTAILEFFTILLSAGCCSGIADSLFEQIIRKKSLSLAGSVSFLNSESIFYHQILNYLFTIGQIDKIYSRVIINLEDVKHLIRKRDEHDKIVGLLESCLLSIQSDGAPSKEEIRIHEGLKELHTRNIQKVDEFMTGTEQRIAEFNKQCEWRLKNLRKNHYFKKFLDSENFPITAPPMQYQNILEKTMRAFPKSQDFLGVVILPAHVISFQYGPKGNYLFDPYLYEKGLFSYPDAETFCKELAWHVFDDACRCKQNSNKERDKALSLEERIEAITIETAKRVRPHFSIQPLDSIHLRYSSKKN
jgi:hypothetical protein